MRAFCLSVGTRLKLGQGQGLMLGQMLAQELQGAVLTCRVMLSLNTAPQNVPSCWNTLHKMTNNMLEQNNSMLVKHA